MGVEANAITLPLEGATLSHAPPESVAVAMVNPKDPPPRLDTETGRDRAAAFTTNGNVIEDGFTLRLGCPGAVTVSDTGMFLTNGEALLARMAMLPTYGVEIGLNCDGSVVIC